MGRRPAIASAMALMTIAAACSSDTADSAPESGGSVADASSTSVALVESDAPVVTAASSGAGDPIAFCSIAADTTRAVDAEALASGLAEMSTVAPSLVADDLDTVIAGWASEIEDDAGEMGAAVDALEAFVLDECGVVAAFDPPS